MSKKDIAPCVEIMTGARFPQTFVDEGKERACERLEDVNSTAVCLSRGELGSSRSRSQYFQTLIDNAPERALQRTILWCRNDIPCNRSMSRPLGSLGISEIAIENRDLVQGEELVSLSAVTKEHLVKGAEGPFLETALRNLGVEAQFWGVIPDDSGSFTELVSNKASTRERRRPHQHRQVRFCGSWSWLTRG